MILIVGAPVLYFMAIGENPFFDSSNGTKKVAVVNEDTGSKKKKVHWNSEKKCSRFYRRIPNMNGLLSAEAQPKKG